MGTGLTEDSHRSAVWPFGRPKASRDYIEAMTGKKGNGFTRSEMAFGR